MKLRADEGSTYEQPPTGPMAAVLTRIIDIGTHTDVSPQYGEQTRHQVILMWELAELMASGEPYTIQKFYRLSMNEKANLRKDLESWRGRAFEVAEEFEIDTLLGKPCLLNIGESQTGKSKIVGISRLPKGMTAPTPRGELLLFNLAEPDWDVHAKLSEFHRGKIESSAEWSTLATLSQQQVEQRAAAETTAHAAHAHTSHDDDFDDDIPF